MKKKYVSPELDIFYDVAEPTLASGSHDIDTVDNNNKNGGSTLGDVPGINWGTNPDNPEDGYDPGTGGFNYGDLDD